MEYSNHESQEFKDDFSSEDTYAADYLLSKDEFALQQSPSSKRRSWHMYLLSALGLTLAFAVGVLIGSGPFIFDKNNTFTRYVSRNSPILNEVDLSYHIQNFNGSLFKANIYRQPASPAVDEAWDALGVNYRSLTLTPVQAEVAGLRKDQVKINPKYGGGYPANVEGLHQLHCLNLVRQSLFYNIDYYRAEGKGAFVNEDRIIQAHVSHCLDIIRQQLMCTVDVGFLGQVWWDPMYPKAFVDFNTEHKCRNFDAVRQWAKERQLPEVIPEDFLQPPEDDDLIYDEIP